MVHQDIGVRKKRVTHVKGMGQEKDDHNGADFTAKAYLYENEYVRTWSNGTSAVFRDQPVFYSGNTLKENSGKGILERWVKRKLVGRIGIKGGREKDGGRIH